MTNNSTATTARRLIYGLNLSEPLFGDGMIVWSVWAELTDRNGGQFELFDGTVVPGSIIKDSRKMTDAELPPIVRDTFGL